MRVLPSADFSLAVLFCILCVTTRDICCYYEICRLLFVYYRQLVNRLYLLNYCCCAWELLPDTFAFN